MSSNGRKRKSASNPSPPSSPQSASRMTFCPVEPAPFDDDLIAQNERDSIDYSIKITVDMAKSGKAPRKVRIYADGIYDLFHQGHARQLMQAKNVFGSSAQVYLLVGCTNDALTWKRKGKTVMTEDERYEAIRHCKYVDEVVRNAPWECDEEFLTHHKIDFVAHDEAPYVTGSGVDVYAPLKAKGMFIATERTEGVSTSDVVARIVRDYDMYIRRNLARGYSRQDLNVSFLRGQRLKLANKVDEVKEHIERKKGEYVTKIEETSKDIIGSFMALFGARDWSIDAFWNRSKERITHVLGSPSASPKHEDSESDDDGKILQSTQVSQNSPPPQKKRQKINSISE